jgi:Flp pilus assembly pilin Flp
MRRFARVKHKGQGLVEYGLVLVLITVVVAVALAFTGDRILGLFSTVVSMMPQP